MSVKEIIDKTTAANIAAFFIVTAGLVVTVYFGKWEIASAIIGAGIGYLFKQKA